MSQTLQKILLTTFSGQAELNGSPIKQNMTCTDLY